MELTWYGMSCFRMIERGKAAVVTDPYDSNVVGFSPLKLRADILTISHDAPGHNYQKAITGKAYLIDGPGEYEVGGVFITGIGTAHKRKGEDGANVMYVFDFDGLTIAHLGDLNRVLTQSEVEALGTVNVLLVPVGGGNSLTQAKAVEVISQIEPNIVVPMHYQTPGLSLNLSPLNRFLKEMGLDTTRTEVSLKLTTTGLPEETQVVVLEPQQKQEV